MIFLEDEEAENLICFKASHADKLAALLKEAAEHVPLIGTDLCDRIEAELTAYKKAHHAEAMPNP